MSSIIVAITGLLENSHGKRRIAGAGKDEVAKIFVEKGWVSISFADVMKRWCKELFDFTDDQLWSGSEKRVEPDRRFPRELSDIQEAIVRGVKVPREYLFPDPNLTPRYALQKLGDWGRDCYPDCWADYTLKTAHKALYIYTEDCKIRGHKYDPKVGLSPVEVETLLMGVVIPDMRFQNEFRRVKEDGGKVIRVKRYCEEFPSVMDDSHISERDILAWGDEVFDHVIENVGDLERLRKDTECLIKLL
jgi:hypothetical protein